MKRIKTELRNRLTTRVLDCLMRISIDGPDSGNFDFDRAATKWANRRNRVKHDSLINCAKQYYLQIIIMKL